jgi:hypothetical protein
LGPLTFRTLALHPRLWPKLPRTFRCGEAPSKTARSKHLPARR